jgi:GTP-binding protein EngB required for normal cell division/uncharacterized protein (DUF697 family)
VTESTKYDPQADMAAGYQAGEAEWTREGGKLNVLVAGNTGAGKSTLIKAVFGSDLETPPEVGTGGSQTMKLARYSVPGKPFAIFDTRGFETGGEEAVKMVDDAISRMRASPIESEQLHMVWLCVEQSVGRFETAHEAFAGRLKAANIPFIVVVTKSFDDAGALEEKVREMIGADVPVVNVLAEEKASRAGTIPTEGLENLLEQTSQLISEARRRALDAAQVVSWKRKDAQARMIIALAMTAAGSSTFVPVPGGQIMALAGVQGKMMHDLDVLAGFTPNSMMKYVKMAGLTAARSGGLKLFQLGLAQALKVFPGFGSAVGVAVGAGVGGTITGALGYAYWNAAKLAATSGKLVTADEFARAFAEYRAKGDIAEAPPKAA